MTVATKKCVFRCARCDRRLRDGKWIYSGFTNLRYCRPGDRGSCLK